MLSILNFSFNPSFSQQADTSGGYKLFFEKVYLHIDRSYYASGDDIWFKAYLVNAQTNTPISTSNNLYVELIDPNAEIISRKVIRIDSIGVGDFHLEDSIAGGTYRIRAYTNWMKNFGTSFIFEKKIEVTNIPGLGKGISSPKKSTPKRQASASSNKIQFLPESGSMVEDVPVLISFKAEDANGKGVEASGYIFSSKGDTVANFKTLHLGMGSFSFTPKAGEQYKAAVQYLNNVFVEQPFPAASPNGFVMAVTNTDSLNIILNINCNAATTALHSTGIMNVAARHAGKSYFKQQVTLTNGKAAVVIPKKDFPPGIANVTLYDEEMHPHCERLVYIDNNPSLKIAISTDKSLYHSKEKTTLHISVTDLQDKPIKAALSMAIVDDAFVPKSSHNISSYLLLESDLPGEIENASSYFDNNNPQRLQQLDLLLRTQGWRSFLWRQIVSSNIRISYLPEPGITISGKVTKPFSNKTLENTNITLFAPEAKGDKIYLTKTDANGRYYLDGLPLYGLQTIKLNAGDAIGKKIAEITMDTMFTNPLPVSRNIVYTIDTSSTLRSFAKEASKRWSIFKNSQWYNILPPVTVSSKRNTTVLRDGSIVTNFGYPEYNFNITAQDYKYERLRDFIVQKVPGARYDDELEGVVFLNGAKLVRPVLFVNKQQDVFGRLDYYSLGMNQVESVSVRHLVGAATYNGFMSTDDAAEEASVAPGNGFRDYFLVTLRIKRGNADQQVSSLKMDITGYYEGRVFYAPNYSTADKEKEDSRITIHWAPFIKTDEKGNATVTFYNADPKGKVRADVQGLTTDGVPIVSTTQYEVK